MSDNTRHQTPCAQPSPTPSTRSAAPSLEAWVLSGVPARMRLTPEAPQNPSQTTKPATQSLGNPETLEVLPSSDGEVLPKMVSKEVISWGARPYLCSQQGQQQEWQACPCSYRPDLEHSPWRCPWACGWAGQRGSPPSRSCRRRGRAAGSGRRTGCSRTASAGRSCRSSLCSRRSPGHPVYLERRKGKWDVPGQHGDALACHSREKKATRQMMLSHRVSSPDKLKNTAWNWDTSVIFAIQSRAAWAPQEVQAAEQGRANQGKNSKSWLSTQAWCLGLTGNCPLFQKRQWQRNNPL